VIERPEPGERAVLVHVDVDAALNEDELGEFRQLVESAGATPVGWAMGRRKAPDPKTYVGRGKADEIAALVADRSADLVIFNHGLSPSQERNLERALHCRVLDRTGLILDIFAQRARSFEGKLQVELAQLRHLSTRLVRGWSHLERQKGGIGLRGPGETQLETDRRLLGNRIAVLKDRLEKVGRQRGQGRRARERADVPTVSLVGYTNAGKSTLFNRVTDSAVYSADQLFATLDPTLRRVPLKDGNAVVMADTVGFISHLPHELVAAFRSTLQETSEARLLLHVIDAASHQRDHCIEQVNQVLAQIGAERLPQIEVFNKIDLIAGERPRAERGPDGMVRRVWLSARNGEGLDLLYDAVDGFFRRERVHRVVQLGPSDGRLRARLFDLGRVLSERTTADGGSTLEVELPRRSYERLRSQGALGDRVLG
jgi:GTP-binding protein HflX